MARLMDGVRRTVILNGMHSASLSGDICSFKADNTLKMTKLMANVVPTQTPVSGWVNKNLLDPTTFTVGYYISAEGKKTSNSTSQYSAIVPVTAGETYTWSGIHTSASANNKRVHAYADGVWMEQITYESVSGANTQFSITFTVPSGANGICVCDRKDDKCLQIEVGSEATSYSPHLNPTQIGGWTGSKLTITGKNLFALSEYAKGSWSVVADSDYADTYSGRKYSFYHLHGDVSSNPDALGLLGIRIPLGRVTISFYKYYDNNDRVYFHYVGDDAWTNHSGNITSTGRKTYTSSSGKVCDGVALDTTQGSTANGKIGELQIEIGASRTDYVSNTVNAYVCDWTDSAGTVYKGTLNVLTGQFVATHGIVTLDGTEGWAKYSNDYCRLNPTSSRLAGFKGDAECFGNMFSNGGDTYTPANGKFGWKNTGSGSDGSVLYLTFRMDGFTDQSGTTDWKNQLIEWSNNGMPLTVVLKYMTPIEVTFTPQEVRTILGQNNLWADCGTTDLTYWQHN